MRGILVDTINQKVQVVDCDKPLDAWYKLLNCDMVEMPERKIGEKYYTIICDEEGLLKSNPTVSGIGRDGSVMLVGNLLIFNSDLENADVTDLTDDDIDIIKSNMCNLLDTNTGEMHKILMNLEY